MLGAVTVGVALIVLFVVAPFGVAAAVIWFVSWRSGKGPAPIRTSDVLRDGEPAPAEVLTLRNLGTILDVRPMVRLGLRISPSEGAPFDLEVTQTVSRGGLRQIRVGDRVEVRYLPDRSSAALVTGEL